MQIAPRPARSIDSLSSADRLLQRCMVLLLTGVLLTAGTAHSAAGVGVESSDAPRPGALIVVDGDTECTMNFVFKGSDRRLYAGTAGHCLMGQASGITMWPRAEAPSVLDREGNAMGIAVFAVRVPDSDLDFGIFRFHRRIKPDPQMSQFGGPTGLFTGMTTEPELLNTYGQGAVFSQLAPGRQLLAAGGLNHDKAVFVLGTTTPGDSGAPVTTDSDEALGYVVAGGLGIGLPDNGPPSPGNTFVLRLRHHLKLAEETLGVRFRLMKAPTIE